MRVNIVYCVSLLVFLASSNFAEAEEKDRLPRKVEKRTTNLKGLKKDRFLVRSFFDTPIRHVSICRGPDDTYYLTGTLAARKDEAADFQNNDGIFLWKSKDLKNWEEVGQVWSIEKQGSDWQKKFRLNPDEPGGKPVRGMTHPEIHYLNDTFYIPYAMNGQGTGLLKSESGKAEGPYVDLGRITSTETAPSMFQDEDGKVYWIWGPGFIAPMNDDLASLEGATNLLIADKDLDRKNIWHNWGDEEYLNPTGFFIHRTPNGEYIATCSVYNYRNGVPVRDTFCMKAKSVLGPYTRLKPMIPHGGETTIFQKGNDYFASFYGADDWSLFRDRPSVVMLDRTGRRILGPFHRSSRGLNSCITQRGPWDQLEPIINGLNMNDNQLLNAPDGYYYYCGSVWDEAEKFVQRVFRSKNLRDWEEFEIIDCAQIPGVKGAVDAWKSGNYKKEFKGLAGCPMDPEIHYIDGDYYVVFTLYFVDKYPGIDKERLPRGSFLFKSKTGEALGPYEFHAGVRASQVSFLEDDDGTVYVTQGIRTIQKMNPGMNGENQDWRYDIEIVEGINFSTDVGMCPKKVGGKYVIFGYNGFYQNRMMYVTCDTIDGLYSRPKLASTRGAHGWLEKSKHRDDIYYQAHWGASMGFNFWGAAPMVMPVKYELVDGQPTFRSIFDMKPEEAKQYQDEIDRVLGAGVWPK
jgi:hypothetical protein